MAAADVDALKSIGVFATTITAASGGVWGVLRLITKTQRDFVNTASKRNAEQEATISALKAAADEAEHLRDRAEADRARTERKYQETWLDRYELVRLLDSHHIPIPPKIKMRVEEAHPDGT